MAPSRYLAHGERIVSKVRRHLMVLVRPFLAALGAVVGAVVIGVLVSPGNGGDLIDTAVGLVACFFVLRFVWKMWEWWVDRIMVTDRRILEVSGLLTRKVASMPLDKLTDLTYSRSILGRLIGYGRIGVESAGQDQALNSIDYIPNPDEFYRTIMALLTGGILRHPDPRVVHEASWDEEDTGPLPRVTI